MDPKRIYREDKENALLKGDTASTSLSHRISTGSITDLVKKRFIKVLRQIVGIDVSFQLIYFFFTQSCQCYNGIYW